MKLIKPRILLFALLIFNSPLIFASEDLQLIDPKYTDSVYHYAIYQKSAEGWTTCNYTVSFNVQNNEYRIKKNKTRIKDAKELKREFTIIDRSKFFPIFYSSLSQPAPNITLNVQQKWDYEQFKKTGRFEMITNGISKVTTMDTKVSNNDIYADLNTGFEMMPFLPLNDTFDISLDMFLNISKLYIKVLGSECLTINDESVDCYKVSIKYQVNILVFPWEILNSCYWISKGAHPRVIKGEAKNKYWMKLKHMEQL